jgi:hypothetical protein
MPARTFWEYTFSNPGPFLGWTMESGQSGGWQSGKAPFGNTNAGGFNDMSGVDWPADPVEKDDDLWVRRVVDLTGYNLDSARWYIGVDNGYKLYVNGVLISQKWEHGYTHAWEYSGSFGGHLQPGLNFIALALDDGGYYTAFDMQVTASPLDTEPPVLELIGEPWVKIGKNTLFTDEGARMTDNVDGPEIIYSTDTVDTAVPGEYVLTYEAEDSSGNPALPINRTVVVAPGFDDWRGSGELTPDLAEKYVFGGAAGPDSPAEPVTTSLQGNELVLSVIVRTNDPNVTAWGEAATDLASFKAPANPQIVSGTPAANQEGVPDGFERQEFRLNSNGLERGFIRVRANISN